MQINEKRKCKMKTENAKQWEWKMWNNENEKCELMKTENAKQWKQKMWIMKKENAK